MILGKYVICITAMPKRFPYGISATRRRPQWGNLFLARSFIWLRAFFFAISMRFGHQPQEGAPRVEPTCRCVNRSRISAAGWSLTGTGSLSERCTTLL